MITGASSGLGESIARHLAEGGVTVVVGEGRKDRLDAIVRDITAKGGKALAVTVDVTKREQGDALIQVALKVYGKVDITAASKTPPRRLRSFWKKQIG